MRILLTTPSLAVEFGGPRSLVFGLATALRGWGNEVTVAGVGTSNRANVVALSSLASFHGTPIPAQPRRLASAVRRADIVHIVGYRDPCGTVAAFASRRSRRPYLLEPAGMHKRRGRSIRLKALYDITVGQGVARRAEAIVANSTMEANELLDAGIPRDQVQVRPNGIESHAEDLVERAGIRERLDIGVDAPLVLTVARLVSSKGLVPLVLAVSRIDDAHLVIAGPDSGDGTLANLLKTIDELGTRHRVHILEQGLWGGDKFQAFDDADVFCLFSAAESYGIAAGEAAARGARVVLSDRCGIGEWLRGAATIVPYGDSNALTDAIRTLLFEPERREKAAADGRAATATLNWHDIAKSQIGMYEMILAHR